VEAVKRSMEEKHRKIDSSHGLTDGLATFIVRYVAKLSVEGPNWPCILEKV